MSSMPTGIFNDQSPELDRAPMTRCLPQMKSFLTVREDRFRVLLRGSISVTILHCSLDPKSKIRYYRILYLIRYSLYPPQQSPLKSWSNARNNRRVTARQDLWRRDQGREGNHVQCQRRRVLRLSGTERCRKKHNHQDTHHPPSEDFGLRISSRAERRLRRS